MCDCLTLAGDVAQRLCTAAEIKFYMNNYLLRAMSGGGNYLKANTNCNRSSWVPGCEPGWACKAEPTLKVNLKEATQIPTRTSDSQPCCEGFFCPQGLTCMIRIWFYYVLLCLQKLTSLGFCEACPLGSHCPLATLNEASGLCEPYMYPLPAGKTNHTCGGANIWANVGISSGVFCPAGSYCPSTTENITCSSGAKRSRGYSHELTHVSQWLQTALSGLLLLIYNLVEHYLTIRARRRVKSREKAAQILRASEQARLRWKFVGEVVRKNSDSLQVNVSEVDQGGESDKSTPKVDSDEGSTKSKARKKREISKDTQFFWNAFAQIEKEKSREHQSESPTFSQIVSMATSRQTRKRLLLEVSFKDLTVQLKQKQKYLLRCLNGKIVPGRITAIMGPSGAGKTSFLSALTGQTTGCVTTGFIFINGESEPISSYKKIAGFVPQDDIVHGNLTVEENLWFSARCRLSSDLRKEDKILIVERVIENLGLQDVRDSLVGTVEKRGISGGQRKRVNVGLEMVIEPSLLFLDEPTSGLDSASSILLLRALKREACEGVNICMVVHQPSYALFKMFDDLILLARGGFMVYHGTVNKVEEYFGSIGIDVPDRVNPPDYYIDVLEGIEGPNSSSGGVNYKDLPVIWMLQNGYTVPEDMQSRAAALGMFMGHSTEHGSVFTMQSQSSAGEVWVDMRGDTQLKSNITGLSFFRRRDLSNRRTPSVLLQFKYFLQRISKQRLREAKLQATDYAILLIAGACVGTITKIGDSDFGAFGYSYTIIAISLLCQIAALKSFANDKLQYWRERASGMSSLAHFMAKDTVDHFNTLVKPAVYLSMFYFFTNPRSTFLDNYIVLVCLVYCVTGMGYAFAILLRPESSQLFSVLLPVCLTLITTQSLNNNDLKFIANFTYPKWALEALVIANARRQVICSILVSFFFFFVVGVVVAVVVVVVWAL
ncbi:hypothetical protein Cgig2_009668 [Carnegiea gigantea]|uniref:ABC transporter domain-containing protein n=1 Tax=Carnegiea gigantea TaxID=171969 RepID=A0A9Q1JM52_9CARY|nr:hypothetical protein Cgig2_009668 [Carnegiea gigantea]